MRAHYLCIAIVAVASQLFCEAHSKTYPPLVAQEDLTKQLLNGKTWTPAGPLLETMYSRIAKMNDYIFESNLQAIKDDKFKTGAGKFYFKKDQRIRVEVKSSGINNGAVVVRKEDGQIRGAGGGMLKFVTMNLEPDSRMLQLPSGRNLLHSDMASLLADLKAKLKKGCQVRVTNETVSAKNWNGAVKIIEVTEPDGNVSNRIFVRTSDNVPAEWDLYKDGELYSMSVFENFQPNPGLQDSLFEM